MIFSTFVPVSLSYALIVIFLFSVFSKYRGISTLTRIFFPSKPNVVASKPRPCPYALLIKKTDPTRQINTIFTKFIF